MDTAETSDRLFSLGWCAGCNKEVLTHLDYDDTDHEALLCVHCDAPVATDLRLADENELGEREYAVIEEEPGCGRPDCGRGRCGQ